MTRAIAGGSAKQAAQIASFRRFADCGQRINVEGKERIDKV